MRTGSVRSWVVGGSVASLVALGGGAAIAAGWSSSAEGPDYLYGASAFTEASARVHVVHTGAGQTHVTLHVTGVESVAGQRFGAHVHTQRCGPSGADAGGHYQHAGATGSLEDREIWLDVTVNEAGNAHAVAVRPWSLDESSPRSVIIHALPTAPDTGVAGARLACIDLDGDR
jgi:Cu-Zn family superoxide dismutase